ncbi:MAG: c-type cytochrome [Verrucomicrobiales bacterium]
MHSFRRPFSLFLVTCSAALAEPTNRPVEKNPALNPLLPEESMKRLKVAPGFRIELIASEPLIREPVALTWDGNGRMFVVEMRGYMRDINGTGAREPVGRISLLEDTDGDGRTDKHSVYLDGLVEPRAVLAIDDGLLVGEPPDLWYCRDSDGDGKSDTKERVFDQFSRRDSNVEHKANSPLWGIDNWIHVSQHGRRYQVIGEKVRHERVQAIGQWGLARDDEGRFIFSSNSDPAKGLFVPPHSLGSEWNKGAGRSVTEAVRPIGDYHRVWPAMVTPDLQSGPDAARKSDGTLSHYTSACGQTFFRGDRLGDGINGDYFVCEPVGRLVRRSKVNFPDSGHVELTNPHENDIGEFISSTDGNFRPVNCYTGPDGCLYIVDMYHGIIQERNFITPYLREAILKAGYEKSIGRGRIYRVVREGVRPGPKPTLLDAQPSELVKHLAHPNGWWRDTAQSILVTRSEQSVGPALREMALKHENPLARLHALWTLDGLGKLDFDTYRALTGDVDPRIRAAAVRAMRPYILRKQNPVELYNQLEEMLADASPLVIAQIVLTVGQADTAPGRNIIAKGIAKHPTHETIFHSVQAVTPAERLVDYLVTVHANPVFQNDPLSADEGAWLDRWRQLCIAGTVSSGNPEALARLFSVIAETKPKASIPMLQAISNAMPANDKKVIALKSKPEGLTALEQRPEPEIREQLKHVSALVTWPGLPTYEQEAAGQPPALGNEDRVLFDKGKVIYHELCTACHGPDGQGMKAPAGAALLGPPLSGSPRLHKTSEAAIQTMLHGLIGELDGKKYEGLMAPLGAPNSDEWVASVLTYMKREWGNAGSPVQPSDVASLRERFKDRKTPWTQAELSTK